MSVRAFLEQIKPIGKNEALRFVTGNQLADMDSVISAICYAFFFHQKNPHTEPYRPLLNISKEDLRLRKDIELALSHHNIQAEHLWFLEDVEGLTKNTTSPVDLILVDHCNLQGELLTKLYAEKRLKVNGIIDHHADENEFLEADPRVIHSNGSCSALVFNYWSQLGVKPSKDVIELLLAPLLLDTSNMTQKVEEGDTLAYNKYRETLNEATVLDVSMPVGFDSLYKTLKKAKKDLDGFSAYDLLRKDYKQFRFTSVNGDATVGFSSLVKLISWILKKYTADEIINAFQDISLAYGLDLLVLTTSFSKKENDEYTREFAFYQKNSRFDLIASHAGDLQLNDNVYGGEKTADRIHELQKSVSFKVYNQVNTNASRKQVVPIIKDIIQSGKF